VNDLLDPVAAQTLARLAEEIRAADARLTAPGSPFEVGVETVLGAPMHVFTHRKRSIGEFLDASREQADQEFLVFDGGRRVTFGEHYRLVDGVAAALAETYEVGKGDRVVVCGANSLGWILTAMACARLGAVAVAFNSWWSPDELAAAVELSAPKVMVADARRRAPLAQIAPQLPLLPMETVDTDLGRHAPNRPPVDIAEDDPWVLAFTSGTSGRPKAATLTHRCLIGFVQLNAYIGARSALLAGRTPAAGRQQQTVRLAVFPLFHISGLSSIISTLAFGTKTVWPAGRFDAGRVIELTREEGITMWGGASTHLVRLLDHPSLAELDTTQLVSVGIGGSASTPSLIARTEAAIPHLKNTFSTGYGMTECGGLASHASNPLLRTAADCVGTPFPTVDVKIIGEDGADLPEGEVGSICIRSPILMTEYWRNPAANAAAMLPGRWLRTEDFGRLQLGLLFIASRVRDLIIRGGENVYPIEVENCLDAVDDVVESAVYGRDDDEFGQVVVATAVVHDGADVTAEQLRQHCAAALAYYKVPVQIDVRTTPLPRNAAGKVLKALIAEGREELTPVDPD
jgi:acyl-CoA synthetase (AMP-forming)/AMP-acid ligase II